MRLYTTLILSSLILFYGCNSKKNKKVIQSTDINISTTIQTKQHKSNAYLRTDDNKSITISKTTIQTNICNDTSIIILNIFAPWSKTSISQLQILQNLQKQYKLCIISIATDSDSNNLVLKQHQITYPVIFDLQNKDFIDKISQIINIDKNFKIPMIIIYKNNNYIDNYQGFMPSEMLEFIIKDK